MSKSLIDIKEMSATQRRSLLAELLLRDRLPAEQNHTYYGNSQRTAVAPRSLHPYEEYVNPYVGKLLRNLRMDKRYVRGEGCWLFDEKGNRYLDFTAAYGALPFGFNPPEVWEVIRSVDSRMEPSFIQPSMLEASGALGGRLVELAPPGLRYVTFVNSGSEAVEVAIKLARSATGRMGIISTENSFHGKTLGALSATGRTIYQSAFGAPAPHFARIPYGSLEALEELLANNGNDIAAFIVEPIQGEGGIQTPPVGYLRGARELCTRHNIFLILDEVQTGLGRTGKLFACEYEEVSPDIMTLAKALGGGIVPVGAVLCSEEAYTEEFATKHTSTFANNSLSCRVGLCSLEMLTRNNQALIRQVADNGEFLKTGLEKIMVKYPRLIKSIRGRGYILGVEITDEVGSFDRPCLMESMAVQETLALAVCSYILNLEGIRLAPTLFGSRVIRIEPPLIMTRELCLLFLEAFERTIKVLADCHTEKFFAHIIGIESSLLPVPLPSVPRRVARASSDPEEGRWGFIVHPLNMQSYIDMDPGLGAFSPEQLQNLTTLLNDSRMNDIQESIIIGTCHLTSATGQTSYGEFIGLTYTADELMNMTGDAAAEKVRNAVKLAYERGAQIVGLGGFSSVVTKNGLLVNDLGVPITTGNSYTVACAVETLKHVADMCVNPLSKNRIAVVGATGSIGRAAALLLSEEAGSMILVGNPDYPQHSSDRLRKIAFEIVDYLKNCQWKRNQFATDSLAAVIHDCSLLQAPYEPHKVYEILDILQEKGLLVISTDSDCLLEADYIITATSSTRSIITTRNLKPGAIVCDISRPSNVSQSVRDSRPDVLILDGGVVELPKTINFDVNYGLDPGLTYACMAETMIMALERNFRSCSLGAALDENVICKLQSVASKHGFNLGELYCSGRILRDSDLTRMTSLRTSSVEG